MYNMFIVYSVNGFHKVEVSPQSGGLIHQVGKKFKVDVTSSDVEIVYLLLCATLNFLIVTRSNFDQLVGIRPTFDQVHVTDPKIPYYTSL